MATGPYPDRTVMRVTFVETLWSEVLYLCMKMTHMVTLVLVRETERLGDPEVKVCFP